MPEIEESRDISGNRATCKCFSKGGWMKKSVKVVLWATLTLLLLAQLGSVVNAQDFWPLENPFSPLASFPMLRGEAKLTPIFVSMQNGSISGVTKENGPTNVFSFSGKNTFFLDLMARLQLSRFSARGYLEQREFSGHRTDSNEQRYANLTYYGFRMGGDVDIFLGNRTRVGFNYDHSFYGPTFTLFNPDGNGESSPLIIQGSESGTIGLHAVYNPVWDVFGMSAIAEGWAHWPIYGTSLSDYEVSGGLRWADTLLDQQRCVLKASRKIGSVLTCSLNHLLKRNNHTVLIEAHPLCALYCYVCHFERREKSDPQRNTYMTGHIVTRYLVRFLLPLVVEMTVGQSQPPPTAQQRLNILSFEKPKCNDPKTTHCAAMGSRILGHRSGPKGNEFLCRGAPVCAP